MTILQNLIASLVCRFRSHQMSGWYPVSDRQIGPDNLYIGQRICLRCGAMSDPRLCVNGRPMCRDAEGQ